MNCFMQNPVTPSCIILVCHYGANIFEKKEMNGNCSDFQYSEYFNHTLNEGYQWTNANHALYPDTDQQLASIWNAEKFMVSLGCAIMHQYCWTYSLKDSHTHNKYYRSAFNLICWETLALFRKMYRQAEKISINVISVSIWPIPCLALISSSI